MVAGSAAGAALPGERVRVSGLIRMLESEKLLATVLLAPGVVILLLFIAYPFVMAIWFSLTSIKVGDPGQFVGLANFTKAWNDTIFQNAFRNTFFYTSGPRSSSCCWVCGLRSS